MNVNEQKEGKGTSLLGVGESVFWERSAYNVIREQAAMSGVALEQPVTEEMLALVREALDRDDVCRRSIFLKGRDPREQAATLATARAALKEAASLTELFARIQRNQALPAGNAAVEIRPKRP